MKKIWLYILCAIIWIVVIACGYCMIQWHIIQDKTYSYLETYGYTEDDIEQVDLKHSFLNKLLWYQEWRILVEFKNEPDIYYRFTYRNHEILKTWISSEPMLDKDKIIEYENMFENGELKYNSVNEKYTPVEEWTKSLVENPRERADKEDLHQTEWIKTLDSWIWNFPYWHYSSKNLKNNLISFESDSEDWTINRFAIYDRNNHKRIFDCFDWWWGRYIEVDESIDIDKIDVNSCKEKYDEVVIYLENRDLYNEFLEDIKSSWEQPQGKNNHQEEVPEENSPELILGDSEENILVVEEENMNTDYVINLKIWDKIFDLSLEKNSATKALIEKLQEWDIIVNAREYWWFEKVGNLGFDLPRADKQITTEPGDLVLYQWNQISLFYESNSWSYTKLWKVGMISKDGLKEILWDWDVKLVFSLLK